MLREGTKRPSRRCWAVLVALLLVLSYAYASHPEGRFTRGGLVHGDGLYAYVYTRSLVLDGDVDFTNDYEALGNPHERRVGPRGRPENRFTIGAGLLWIPTFTAAMATAAVGRALGLTDAPLDGTSPLVQRITLFGSVLLAWGTAVVVVILASAFVGELAACLAGVACMLATPLAWYAAYQPSWSHAASAFCVALLVLCWFRWRDALGPRRWLLIGALVGGAALVRPQNAAFVILPLGDLAVRLAGALRSRDRDATRAGLVATAAVAVGATAGFLPQMIVWQLLYGAPLTVPQGDAFLLWHEIQWSLALFSSRGGLFTWTPLAYVAVVTLTVVLVRGSRLDRRVTALLLLAFAAQLVINGATADWWGGWAYGGRRFLGCTVIFGVGLAVALDGLAAWVRARSHAVVAAVPVLVVAAFAVCNVEQMDDYLHGRFDRGEATDMRAVTRRSATRLVDGVYDLVGHPWSAPANWVFAGRADVEPTRWDLAAGQELVTGRANERGWEYLRMPDERWTMDGFGPPVRVVGQPASWVTGEHATLVLGMREPIDLDAVLFLRPSLAGVETAVAVGNEEVFRTVLEPGWQTYELEIPAHTLRGGLNYVRITQDLPPRPLPPRSSVGRTGKDVSAELTAERAPDGTMTLRVNQDTFTSPGPGVWAAHMFPDASTEVLGRFDTRNRRGTAALVEALGALEPGDVAVVIISGQVYERWSDAATGALRRLGAGLDPAAVGPPGYALIGVVGAAPGSAVEITARDGRAVAEVGRPTNEREHGVAWGWITLARRGVTPRFPGMPMRGK